MKIFKFSAFILAAALMSSCQEDDDTPPPTPPENEYEVPANYVFTDENGNNTVDYSGQTDRLDQLSQMVTYMKQAREGEALSGDALLAMYSNEGGNGGGNFDFTSDRQLRNKTAVTFADAEVVRQEIETWMTDLAETSQTTVEGEYNAAPGAAGLLKTGETGPFLVDANGREHLELIEKGLMSAVFYNQITGVYLSDEKIGDQVNNTDPVDPENGKYYTEMEHHWDEAFGYFTSSPLFPEEGADRFWAGYCDRVDEALGTNEKIMNAYLTGRAAISNGDMATKEEMRDIIISELERVAAGKAVGYLGLAADNFSNDALRNHVLSEAVGFIDGLRYNPHATMSTTEINGLLDEIGENFYEVTLADINSVQGQIISAMGFTPDQVENL